MRHESVNGRVGVTRLDQRIAPEAFDLHGVLHFAWILMVAQSIN
jgi:hypothetical protein